MNAVATKGDFGHVLQAFSAGLRTRHGHFAVAAKTARIRGLFVVSNAYFTRAIHDRVLEILCDGHGYGTHEHAIPWRFSALRRPAQSGRPGACWQSRRSCRRVALDGVGPRARPRPALAGEGLSGRTPTY